ncbi:ABC transporter ATP-binding protein [Nakamurella sp. YIM 132084]|uniref:ABC transporter ATP-binding protein n=1 Tax=Nakamurella leprariae TaxID=2803911 RepID=A0A938YCX8_9ACTN|nr:ABC transporter ATP-binding protein [Nakamurella leprariae]
MRTGDRAGERDLVRGVSFAVGTGERVGIIGESGSGKTLTCLAAAGLLPDGLTMTGSIAVRGSDRDLVSAGERELARLRGELVGMVFQEPMTALDPTMRVGRQVAEAIRLHARRTSAAGGTRRVRGADPRVLALLAETGLDDPDRVARAHPHQLSGGQRQRVVLAMALAGRPGLLVCDEPTTALDVTVQARVLDLIDRRAREVGAAVLFISHDLAVVASLCDRVLVLYRGELVEQGPTVQVLTDPQHDHTRRLLADSDLTGPMLDGGPVR